MTPAWAGDGLEQFAHGLVGEMAVAAGDALLRGPGPFQVGLEQLGAVIGLNNDHVDIAQPLVNVAGGVTEAARLTKLRAASVTTVWESLRVASW